jgi:hypothetical protein
MRALLALFLTAGLTACATSRKLDQKLAQQPPLSSQKNLADKYKDLVESSNLQSQQKAALLALRDENRKQGEAMRQEALKLRSLLIQDVLASKYNAKEVNLLKRRISKLEKKRTALLFDTIDRANEIMGRSDFSRNQLMEGLIRPDLLRGDF